FDIISSCIRFIERNKDALEAAIGGFLSAQQDSRFGAICGNERGVDLNVLISLVENEPATTGLRWYADDFTIICAPTTPTNWMPPAQSGSCKNHIGDKVLWDGAERRFIEQANRSKESEGNQKLKAGRTAPLRLAGSVTYNCKRKGRPGFAWSGKVMRPSHFFSTNFPVLLSKMNDNVAM